MPLVVVMTLAERRVLEAHAEQALRPLAWRYHPQTGFTVLNAAPCPFVTDDNRCGVYDVRPYNCRRFACMRPDPSAEPFGGAAMDARLRAAETAPAVDQVQAEAQPWALAHGWKAE